MSVSDILGVFGSYDKLTSTNDEDWLDRLNHVHTVGLLVLFAIFVAGGQYVGDPIECMRPHLFSDDMGYINTNCWINNTYYVPKTDNSIPSPEEIRENQVLTYYQWVPQILILMAFLFKIPSVIWRMFNSGTGINMDKMVILTAETQMGDANQREETVGLIAKYLDRWLMSHRHHKTTNILERLRQHANRVMCFMCSKRDGTYLVGLYLLVKLLYVANVVAQFFILNSFMGSWYSAFGYKVLTAITNNANWQESKVFPKVTFCNVEIRQSGINQHTYTTQCVLPINLFNEWIFIFIWYWYVIVAVCSCGNFLFWVWRSLYRRNRVAYIKKYLKMINEVCKVDDKRMVKDFADHYLRDDGVFVMRMIARNTNDILLSDIVRHMWVIYKEKKRDLEAKRAGQEKLRQETHRQDVKYPILVSV